MASHDPADQRPAPVGTGPRRILVLDRDPAGPRWVIATVSVASDVRPATLDESGRYAGWPEVAAWVAGQVGGRPSLVPLHDPLAWRIDERP